MTTHTTVILDNEDARILIMAAKRLATLSGDNVCWTPNAILEFAKYKKVKHRNISEENVIVQWKDDETIY